MKKYLFGVLAVALVIGFSAYTTKSDKAFTPTGFIYTEANIVSTLDLTDLQTVSNWSQSTPGSLTSGSKLDGIDFELEAASDGGNDGQLSIQEAIDALRAQYNTTSHDFPVTQFEVATGTGSTPAVVKIYRKN